MSNTPAATDQTTAEQTATEPAFKVGDPCGVCQFPIGIGKICGNVVYANQTRGRLPRYCGQAGQAEHQAAHGTTGDPAHMSDRAAYPRRVYSMSKEEATRLADEAAARLGIGPRRHHTDAEEPAPAATEPEPATTVEAPKSAIDELAELATAFIGRVGTVREEMQQVRDDAEARVQAEVAEKERVLAEVAEEKAALAKDRQAAQADSERAVIAVKEADDARLQLAGELKAAKERIAELEAALDAAEQRRIAEVEEVRKEERAEFRLAMREFASTVRNEATPEKSPAERESRPVPEPSEEARESMMKRIRNGHVTVVDRAWVVSNTKATTATARTLDQLYQDGRITVTEQGKVREKIQEK